MTQQVKDESAGTNPRPSKANEVLKVVSLRSVRFNSFSARAFEHLEGLPDDVAFHPNVGFTKPKVVTEGQALSAKTTFVFGMKGKLPTGDVQTYCSVRATTEVIYVSHHPSWDFTQDDLQDFAEAYCAFHAWGYWREFLQSTLARLDLPSFTLPLLWISERHRLMISDDLADEILAEPARIARASLPFGEPATTEAEASNG